MLAVSKTSRGTDLIPLETQFYSERTLFLEGEIISSMACDLVRQILYLSHTDPKAPINLLINSPGGEINAGLLLYDVIQTSKTPIRLVCLGRAYSMAALLFASGRHGRFMLNHSELMLHEPLLADHLGGSSSSIKSLSDSLLDTKRKINRILSIHTGKSEEEIEAATRYDHFFDPHESIDFGLCDRIIGIDAIQGGMNHGQTNG